MDVFDRAHSVLFESVIATDEKYCAPGEPALAVRVIFEERDQPALEGLETEFAEPFNQALFLREQVRKPEIGATVTDQRSGKLWAIDGIVSVDSYVVVTSIREALV